MVKGLTWLTKVNTLDLKTIKGHKVTNHDSHRFWKFDFKKILKILFKSKQASTVVKL